MKLVKIQFHFYILKLNQYLHYLSSHPEKTTFSVAYGSTLHVLGYQLSRRFLTTINQYQEKK